MDKSKPHESQPQKLPPVKIRRAVILEMTIYEVAEDELEALCHGAPDSVYLNFTVFLLSIATAFLISIITTQVSDRTFTVFVILIVVGYILGVLFLILWYRNRRSISLLVKRIKERLPPEGIQEPWVLDELEAKKE